MKQHIRKLVAFVLVVMMSMSFSVSAFASEKDITLGSIEQELITYMEEYHPDIVFGTADFVSYMMGVLVEDADETLAAFPNYEEIRYYAGEYMYELEEYQIKATGGFDIFIPSEFFRDTTLAERKEEIRQRDVQEERFLTQIGTVPAPYAITYNKDAAVTYARKHAKSYNKMYNSHPKDCTNFASQVLFAGGGDMIKHPTPLPGIYETINYWYSIKYDEWHGNNSVPAWKESTSWVRVTDLYSYCTYKGAEVASYTNLDSLQENIQVGDIVQLRNADGSWFHSIVITGGSPGDFTYCAHTTNKLDEKVSTLGEYPRYRLIRF